MPCSCCDNVDTTVSVLESCKQALDKHHQVDASCFALLPLSSLTHGWCGVISLLSVSASCQQAGVCVHCAQIGPDTLLDISVEFSLMVCCQLSAWTPECICPLSDADAGITSGLFANLVVCCRLCLVPVHPSIALSCKTVLSTFTSTSSA